MPDENWIIKGPGVRIIVHQPSDWNKGNLFGTILSDRGGKKLIIRLSEPIQGKLFSSDVIELRLENENEKFKPLWQYYALMVYGTLIADDAELRENIFFGSVAID